MSKLLYLLFFSPFILLFTYAASNANQEAPSAVRPTTASTTVSTANGFLNQGQASSVGLARKGSNRSPYSEAVRKLKDAENDEQKDDAITEIRGELEKQYEAFLKSNERQIEELQKRIDGLKDQLDRRRSAKKRMVDLEVERIVNESEGLVWPSSGRSGFFGSLAPGYNRIPTPSFPGEFRYANPTNKPAPQNNYQNPFRPSR